MLISQSLVDSKNNPIKNADVLIYKEDVDGIIYKKGDLYLSTKTNEFGLWQAELTPGKYVAKFPSAIYAEKCSFNAIPNIRPDYNYRLPDMVIKTELKQKYHPNVVKDIKGACSQIVNKIKFDETLSDEFIEQFKKSVDWKYTSINQKLSIEFIREFKDYIYWRNILTSQKLSEEFIREFQDNVNWLDISYYQILSEEFIREFQSKVYWNYISASQKLSEKFILEFKDYVNWDNIFTKQILSIQFMEENCKKPNWALIKKFFDCNKQQVLNPNLTSEFIDKQISAMKSKDIPSKKENEMAEDKKENKFEFDNFVEIQVTPPPKYRMYKRDFGDNQVIIWVHGSLYNLRIIPKNKNPVFWFDYDKTFDILKEIKNTTGINKDDINKILKILDEQNKSSKDVTLIITFIVRTCMEKFGKGRLIEDVFAELDKEYKLSNQEKEIAVQLLKAEGIHINYELLNFFQKYNEFYKIIESYDALDEELSVEKLISWRSKIDQKYREVKCIYLNLDKNQQNVEREIKSAQEDKESVFSEIDKDIGKKHVNSELTQEPINTFTEINKFNEFLNSIKNSLPQKSKKGLSEVRIDIIVELGKLGKLSLYDYKINKPDQFDQLMTNMLDILNDIHEMEQETKPESYLPDDDLISKQEVAELSINAKPTFISQTKSDATKAAYRIASNQITKGAKAVILSMIQKQNQNANINLVSKFLDTEYGNAIMSMLLGYGLTYIPQMQNNKTAQTLATEFRVNGMATAGNAIFQQVVEQLVPIINDAMKTLPDTVAEISKQDEVVEQEIEVDNEEQIQGNAKSL